MVDCDTTVLDTGLIRIGAFRAHPSHPAFPDSGPARNFCFVFPRTAVRIQHEHERPFVANPNVVTFYNRHQEYRRAAVSPAGDRCDWFGVDPAVVRDVMRVFDPAVDDRPEAPFRLTRGVSDARTYLSQRRLFEEAAGGRRLDPLRVEEQVVWLLERVARATYGRLGRPAEPAGPPPRDAIRRVEEFLSAHWDRPLHLRDIAREAGLSVCHLCRMFRRATGRTLHQYRAALRVRSSLEAVSDGDTRLIDIALGCGFSSHSHFTGAFRQAFGETPSAFRARRRAA